MTNIIHESRQKTGLISGFHTSNQTKLQLNLLLILYPFINFAPDKRIHPDESYEQKIVQRYVSGFQYKVGYDSYMRGFGSWRCNYFLSYKIGYNIINL